jgi:chromosome segregation ATPase
MEKTTYTTRALDRKVDHLRKDIGGLQAELEEGEMLITKQKKELTGLRSQNSGLEGENMRLNKAKKRLQIEVDNLNAIFDRERQEIIELEVRVKKLHKLLHDEKNIATHLQSEKETLITTNRTLIKKIEDATEKIIQRDSQLVEAERLRKSLKDELDRLGDDKDRLDKLCSDLQNTNSTISHQCHEQNIVIEALEEDLNHKDDEIRGIEIQLKALRDTHKKDLEARDGKIDDLKKALLKAERDLKAALEDEAQKREAILSQKRILETTIATMQVEMDNLKRQLEDAKRKIDQLTEQNKLIPGLQRDLDDALAANDILQKELADAKRRIKSLEVEIVNLNDAIAAANKAKKLTQDEAQDALEELRKQAIQFEAQRADDKRKHEAELAALQAELGELNAYLVKIEERHRKLERDYEDALGNLKAERKACKAAEEGKADAERRVTELTNVNAQLEASIKIRVREAVDPLEKRIIQILAELEARTSECDGLAKALKKAEKRCMETEILNEEARDAADSLRVNLEKTNVKYLSTKSQLEDCEAQISKLAFAKNALAAELDDQADILDKAKREVTSLQARSAGTSTRTSRQITRRCSLEEDDDLGLDHGYQVVTESYEEYYDSD